MGMHQDGRLSQAEPQGSVLGPTLFVIYINDIDDGITSSLLKFADDTKLLRKVGTQDDCEALQKDLHTMHKWSEDWQMLFRCCSTLISASACTLDMDNKAQVPAHWIWKQLTN